MRWILIHKFLSDRCNDAEREQIERWLDANPEHKVFMKKMRQIWEVVPKDNNKIDVEAAWRRFRSKKITSGKLPAVEEKTRSIQKLKYWSRSHTKWYKRAPVYMAAATVLLMAMVLFLVQMQLGQSTKISYQQIITSKGEKTRLKLSDGTRVMLNSESTLKIPSNYGKANRTLYLLGEAFFEVTYDKSKPFRVYSKKIYTEDIGTKFNIRAFPKDSTTEIIVAEGKVALRSTISHKAKRIRMSSYQRAVVSENKKIDVQAISDLSSFIGWTKGKLIFDDTPLREVIKKLERWYDIRCVVNNKALLHQKLTATFENESLSNVLKLIAKSMDVEATVSKRIVTFSVRG